MGKYTVYVSHAYEGLGPDIRVSDVRDEPQQLRGRAC